MPRWLVAGGACEFWYLAWADARSAHLVDLIRRPTESVVRVAVFRRGEPAQVLRQRFPRDALVADADGAGVTLGSWRLDRHHCAGRIEGLALDCHYQLHQPEVTMVPAWIGRLFPTVPALRTTAGTIVRATAHSGDGDDGAGVGDAGVGAAGESRRDLPCVYSRYRVGAIARARWFLISAPSFEASDVRCEISGGWLGGRWALTGYLRLGERVVALNNPVANLWRFAAQAAGDPTGSARRFELTYHAGGVALRLVAEAPTEAFVALEREGATTIHTTLHGSCALELTIAGARRDLVARDGCLLEVKG
jgi:hypothetical protein